MGSDTRKNLWIAAGYSAVLTVGLLLGPKFSKEDQNTKNGSFLPFGLGNRSAKVEQVIQIIRENYVDSISLDTVEDMAIQEIVKHLDPHSAYLPPSEAQMMSENLDGNFNGIGIEYLMLNDTLLITAINKGGPAQKAGLRNGDKILAIDSSPVSGRKIATRKIVEQMRGKKGSSVLLTIRRDTIQKKISVERDQILISSIDAAYMLNDKSGYVKISKFGARTDEDFHTELLRLQKAGMKNLILDLRNNGGGYLKAATALADEFLKDKELIVYTQGLHEPRTDYFASQKGDFEQGKLVVLINENSASASEIVAGAIQDLDRGTIIGRRSFGKGLVQEQFDFGDGSALNLTIARYYTASGRSIQKSYLKGKEAYYNEVSDRHKNGELSSDGKGISDSLYNPKKTFTTSSGKVLYAGGGVMPDIYIPVDTVRYSELYYSMSGRGVFNELLYANIVKEGKKYASVADVMKNFKLSQQHIKTIVQLSAKKNLKVTESQVEQSRQGIEIQLKALLSRYYFGDEGYYRILNSGDQAINRSLEVFKPTALTE